MFVDTSNYKKIYISSSKRPCVISMVFATILRLISFIHFNIFRAFAPYTVIRTNLLIFLPLHIFILCFLFRRYLFRDLNKHLKKKTLPLCSVIILYADKNTHISSYFWLKKDNNLLVTITILVREQF